MRISITVATMVSALLLSACGANHNAAYRLRSIKPGRSAILSIDAKQRNVLIKQGSNFTRMCSEPNPDVFSVFAQSLGAGISAGKTSAAQIEAAASLALARSENGATIPRTQTANVVREMLFRTCERFLNDGMGSDELAIQAGRDERLAVFILAIEQLTGVVTPPAVIINAGSQAGAGNAEAVMKIADRQDALDQARGQTKKARDARQKLDVNADDPACSVLTDNETETARKDRRAACVAADKALKDAQAAEKEADARLQDLRGATAGGAVLPVSAAASSAGTTLAGTARTPSDTAITAVTNSINRMVDVLDAQDEFLLFCIRQLPGAGGKGDGIPSVVGNACINYVSASIDSIAVSRNADSVRSVTERLAARDAGNFGRFWGLVKSASNTSEPDKVKAAIRALRVQMPGTRYDEAAITAMEKAELNEQQMRELFNKLAPAEQVRLAIIGGMK